MLSPFIKKSAVTVAALGALGLGGTAVAGAANNTATTTTPQSRPARDPRPALSADVAAKVKAAALAKVPGATVLATEAGGPYSTPYHAHIKTSDGTRKVVLVDASFAATAVQADDGRGAGRGGHGPGGRGDETPLTGDTKTKVEAAVKARYPTATIVRTETNGESRAPYESHVTTSDGKELVGKDFAVVSAQERPVHL